MTTAPELTILMPCLNEAETLGSCIQKAWRFVRRCGIPAEVVVADNGSTDGSQAIARECGATVVDVPVKGYGSALIAGIRAARGRYVIMGDSDDSYDFAELDPFVDKLREGRELVMGNRFRGGIKPGAMPPLHRYLGNPVLTTIGRIFFRSPCGDFHCGLRGFSRDSIMRLGLQSPGMEFASEMVVKATLNGLDICEVPTTLSPDGRSRPPHLRSWRDGWRHLRFLLLFSPCWLFLYPGLALAILGLIATGWILPAPRHIGDITLDIHTLLYAAMAIVVGAQAVIFWACANLHGMSEGILPNNPSLRALIDRLTIERGLVVGGGLIIVGLALAVLAVSTWSNVAFGLLEPTYTMRLAIPSAACIVLGFEIVFGAFVLNVLHIRRPRELGLQRGLP
ncbi:Glycosyltransferase involved in cell wall bisynthesis [Enhydrobacter aerosaccus]|uniref:Glycosyltransferase involved in cell wall bisynthesis n=1 Tax=Enhydrobacter aerosaccus TaxID=225324 RepID=A0A1T4S092_9HYPH|nr:glycosyltransferase family 2 protein [Enhydrobacter aerosaccus]SKA21664.1 Glycosyltransferase involved in cell wall bisynthesis [Enhydrobacter aerosaccus]